MESTTENNYSSGNSICNNGKGFPCPSKDDLPIILKPHAHKIPQLVGSVHLHRLWLLLDCQLHMLPAVNGSVAKIQLISGHKSLSIYQDLSLADVDKEYWEVMEDFPIQ
ncbi:MAG: hypothetical protein QNK19_10675 [Xanthomonadales bacterium]|nr:hypothetical protein [Xanthomonadales bacterium]